MVDTATLTSPPAADAAFLPDDCELARLISSRDWSDSPIGPPPRWPSSLKNTIGLMLRAQAQIVLFWGAEFVAIYNDAYAPTIGTKHPHALGRPAREHWPGLWDDLEPLLRGVRETGKTYAAKDRRFYMERHGCGETVYFDISYSAVPEADGSVGGVLCIVSETTARVLAERRQAFRLALEERLRLSDPREIMRAAVEMLGRHLGANRVGYGEVLDDDRTVSLRSCFADGVDVLDGEYLLDSFGRAAIAAQRQGKTQWSSDLRNDPGQDPAVWDAIDTRAYLSVPLVRNGRFAASLYVNFRSPHAWLADDIALIEEVAERTWSAVERARSESQLRQSEARLRLGLAAAKMVAWDIDFSSGRIRRSENAEAIFGPGGTEVDFRTRMTPEDAEAETAVMRAALADPEKSYESRSRLTHPDGHTIWVYSQGRVVRDASGAPVHAYGVCLDVTDEETGRQALVESERRFRDVSRRLSAVLDNATVSIFLMDADHQCIYMNAAAEALTGFTLAETQGRKLHDVIHHTRPDGSAYPAGECPIDSVSPDMAHAKGEEVFVTKSGSFVPVAFAASSIRDDEGGVVGTIVEVRDITERRKAEEHQRLLIDELNHRARNLLSIIQGIAQQSFRGLGATDSARRAFEGRLAAIAGAHNLLTQRNWSPVRLGDIVETSIRPYDVRPGAIEVTGPNVLVSPKMAVSFALVVHELATNAVKYGALKSPGGTVEVRWRIENGRLRFLWRERGGPAVDMPSTRGFGTKMIERGLAAELGGDVQIEFSGQGVVCTVDAPLPKVDG